MVNGRNAKIAAFPLLTQRSRRSLSASRDAPVAVLVCRSSPAPVVRPSLPVSSPVPRAWSDLQCLCASDCGLVREVPPSASRAQAARAQPIICELCYARATKCLRHSPGIRLLPPLVPLVSCYGRWFQASWKNTAVRDGNASWPDSPVRLGNRIPVRASHSVRELDAHSRKPRGSHIRCSTLQPTVSSTPAYGLRPAADRVTHNHVTLHVDGINHLDSLRVRASSRTLLMPARASCYERYRGIACSRPHEYRTTECKHIFVASMIGILSERDEGHTVRGRA